MTDLRHESNGRELSADFRSQRGSNADSGSAVLAARTFRLRRPRPGPPANDKMIGTPAGLQRRPTTAEGEKRPISAAGIRQDFEGHGIAVLPVLERGYIDGPLRPRSAARALPEDRDGGSSSATGAAASDGSRRRRKKQPAEAMRIHVHLREKTMEVNAGTGGQCIYWLAVTGVQRYVVDPGSYTRPYSEELTPKARRSQL